MKCPNCGTEMPDGVLYCEHCGEDIHIVPDFEPEVELSIEETISEIAQEIRGEDEEVNSTVEISSLEEMPWRRKRFWKITGVTVIVLLIVVMGVSGTWFYLYHSLDYQIQRAEQFTQKEQYDKAINYYSRAIEIDSSDIELHFALAEVYFLKNNKVEYEYELSTIIRNPAATSEQLERAYGKLIAIYRAREDYQTINDLLLASNNSAIMTAYQNYLAMDPEFSIKEGFYNSIQPLKITAFGTGKIYYTMDGMEPNENSLQYTAPILLENGDYTIKAIYVNENGIASNCVTRVYHIENDEIPAPEISALSGEYTYPINIEVLGDDEDIFYTTDGSKPTYSSTPYTGPIPMPLGKSSFCFAKIEKGVTGNTVERTYQLVMNTEVSNKQAEEVVVNYAISIGKIFDEAGYFDDSMKSYHYQYQYVTNIAGIDDFYIISEILRDGDGILTKTGTDFAVNAYTGELFKLQRDGNNRLSLIEIEKNPTEG